MNKRAFVRALATLAVSGFATGAIANKPLTMVVPSAAGSAPDIVARLLGDELQSRLNQPVVIAISFIGSPRW